VALREPPPKPAKNASRNEKDRKPRADGLLRQQQALAEKQAEIDHLHGSLTGVLGQMANFKGVAEIIRDYQQMSIEPWDDNEPVRLDGMLGLRRAGDPRWEEDCAVDGDLQENEVRGSRENEIVRLRAQIATLEERKTGDSESEAEEEMEFAS
jgi:hypothetical protein